VTIGFAGPMVWNVNNATVKGFFEDARPHHALGTTLFQRHTGRNPYGDNLGEVVTRMATGKPDPWPGSPALGALLARAMATDPRLRPTAAQLVDALGTLT
jgi:hypothetical protein